MDAEAGSALAISLPGACVLLAFSIASGWCATGAAWFLGVGRSVDRPEIHWTERARLFWPARSGGITATLLCACSSIGAVAAFTSLAAPLPERLLGLFTFAGVLLGGSLAQRPLGEKIMGQRLSRRYWLQGVAAYWLLILPHLVVAMACGFLMPERFDATAWTLLGAAAILLALIVPGGLLPLGRILGLVRSPSARLREVVERAARRFGMAAPRVWEIVWPAYNAFALPLGRTVAFTDAAVRSLTEGELENICLHELGHLGEPASVLFLRGSAVAAVLPLAALRPAIETSGAQGMLVILLAVAVLFIGLRSAGRRMEVRADRLSLGHEADPGGYAGALERIYQLNLYPAVMPQKKAVHPHLYDRLLAAGVEPAYPRPAPPSRRRTWLAALGGFAAGMLVLAAGFVAASIASIPGS